MLPVCGRSSQVHFESSVSSPEQLVAAVDDCGFDCRLQSVHNVDTEDTDTNRLQVRDTQISSSGDDWQQACTAAARAAATASSRHVDDAVGLQGLGAHQQCRRDM